MVPIKFSDNIKDKLEKRTIQPSGDAWDKLSTDLNTNDKKKSSGLIFYTGIAASIIGVLLVTTVLFNASENQLGEPTVVDSNIKASQIKVEAKAINEAVEKEVIANISEEINTKKDIKSSIKNEQNLVVISNQVTNQAGENKRDNSVSQELMDLNKTEQSAATVSFDISKREQTTVSILTFEALRAVEVVNQINKLEIENGTVTDTEIENLLKQAERAILRERIYNETTRTVDADALLQDVEDDLEQSFRAKVFEGLKLHSKTVITAVSERNN